MRKLLLGVTRQTLLVIGWLIAKLFLRVEFEGRENLPPRSESYILIANHFSWFDPPILGLVLPSPPSFLVAVEAQERSWVALIVRLFDCIPIWRGQVDRTAIRTTLSALARGKVVAIFPEGGINPQMAARVAQGEVIPELAGNLNRIPPVLIPARSGTALIAVMSQAPIVPVGLLGVNVFWNNLRRLRRTTITLRIGAVMGPLTIDPELTGRARRRCLDELTHQMMRSVAELLPHENRGYYH